MCTFHLFSELTGLICDDYGPFCLSECIPSLEDREDGQTYWKSNAWFSVRLSSCDIKLHGMCARKGHDDKLIAATLEASVGWTVNDFIFSLYRRPATTKWMCSLHFCKHFTQLHLPPTFLQPFLGTIAHFLIKYIWRRNVPSTWALVSTTSINMYYW